MRLILGSASPARFNTLTAAGLHPEVMVSKVDEDLITSGSPGELTLARATAKGQDVLARVLGQQGSAGETVIVLACDSMLEIEDKVYGKPGTAEQAVARWQRMRGRSGLLHTGHYVAVAHDEQVQKECRLATTAVTFADLSDAEIEAYAATGEPEHVAGGFTIDGYGGAFVSGIHGDPHNVVGISLPLVRQILVDLGVSWPSLWVDAT